MRGRWSELITNAPWKGTNHENCYQPPGTLICQAGPAHARSLAIRRSDLPQLLQPPLLGHAATVDRWLARRMWCWMPRQAPLIAQGEATPRVGFAGVSSHRADIRVANLECAWWLPPGRRQQPTFTFRAPIRACRRWCSAEHFDARALPTTTGDLMARRHLPKQSWPMEQASLVCFLRVVLTRAKPNIALDRGALLRIVLLAYY